MTNREIKFRAWDDGIMIYSHQHLNINSHTKIIWFFRVIRKDAIIMQFTGLHDKDGKDIYEGDICTGHSDGNGDITWTSYDGGFDYVFDDGNNVGINEVLRNIVVIGNIYETPKLLTQ